jgi:hypothetical protein
MQTKENVMSQLKSIAITALLGFVVASFSGHLARAADPAKPSAAKVYAQGAGLGGQLPTKPTEDFATKSQDRNPWTITNPSGVNIRSRAGFVGYR